MYRVIAAFTVALIVCGVALAGSDARRPGLIAQIGNGKRVGPVCADYGKWNPVTGRGQGLMHFMQQGQKCHAQQQRLYWNKRALRGPRGIRGPAGAAGAVGPKGATGAQGPAGTPGGPKGATGATGAMGVQGLKGDKGDTGSGGLGDGIVYLCYNASSHQTGFLENDPSDCNDGHDPSVALVIDKSKSTLPG